MLANRFVSSKRRGGFDNELESRIKNADFSETKFGYSVRKPNYKTINNQFEKSHAENSKRRTL